MLRKGLPILFLALAGAARGDEGMWLFSQPPRELVQSRYQFEMTAAWLEHLQKAAVRFNSGGSGSFVSEDGLLISNHHVGADALQKLSSEKSNYVRDGFLARTPAEEIKCLDLELNVLQSIEDVTARVNAAVPAGVAADQAFAARRAIIAAIEKESLAATGLRSDVVTLWQGGAYHLYRFKRYTDVRLVFAPEQQIAFYGGDPDNFEFPRCDLDICFFRAYENGQPARVQDFLRYSRQGVADGDLVFVAGHPGRTGRLLTVAELEELRDRVLPARLATLKRLEVLLSNWSERSAENARRARKLLFSTQNSRKGIGGRFAGLLTPELMTAKRESENALKAQLAGQPVFGDALAAYDRIAEATAILANQARRYSLLEAGEAFNCQSFGIARTLLRAAAEKQKPNGERLREFTDSATASLELSLFSEKPIYADLEILTLTDSLSFLAGELGGDDPLVRKILAGRSPQERAVDLIQNTKVRDVAFRKQLYQGGGATVAATPDPMVELARLVDDDARALRKIAETRGEVKQQAHAAIARARNTLLGTAGYPDATFTLRLSYGTVSGYEASGAVVPSCTTFASLYERAKEQGDHPPFDLPDSWLKRKAKLDLRTPLNFVSTCDIIGGNSGSPVVNRAGDFVGIIFDGNLASLSWDYAFSDKQGRAIAVHSAAIVAALDKIYGAKALRQELLTGRRGR